MSQSSQLSLELAISLEKRRLVGLFFLLSNHDEGDSGSTKERSASYVVRSIARLLSGDFLASESHISALALLGSSLVPRRVASELFLSVREPVVPIRGVHAGPLAPIQVLVIHASYVVEGPCVDHGSLKPLASLTDTLAVVKWVARIVDIVAGIEVLLVPASIPSAVSSLCKGRSVVIECLVCAGFFHLALPVPIVSIVASTNTSVSAPSCVVVFSALGVEDVGRLHIVISHVRPDARHIDLSLSKEAVVCRVVAEGIAP